MLKTLQTSPMVVDQNNWTKNQNINQLNLQLWPHGIIGERIHLLILGKGQHKFHSDIDYNYIMSTNTSARRDDCNFRSISYLRALAVAVGF